MATEDIINAKVKVLARAIASTQGYYDWNALTKEQQIVYRNAGFEAFRVLNEGGEL